MITLWRGRNIEELSRAELLECVRALGAAYLDQMTPRAIKARALGEIEITKREPGSYCQIDH